MTIWLAAYNNNNIKTTDNAIDGNAIATVGIGKSGITGFVSSPFCNNGFFN